MKQRFGLYRRSNGTFYCEDAVTHKQESLRAKDEHEARTLLNAKNEAIRQPTMNLQIAQVYMLFAFLAIPFVVWFLGRRSRLIEQRQTFILVVRPPAQPPPVTRWNHNCDDDENPFFGN